MEGEGWEVKPDTAGLRQEGDYKGIIFKPTTSHAVHNRVLLIEGQRRSSRNSKNNVSPELKFAARSELPNPKRSKHGRPTVTAPQNGHPNAKPWKSRRRSPTEFTSKRSVTNGCASAPTSSRPRPVNYGPRRKRPGLGLIFSTR